MSLFSAKIRALARRHKLSQEVIAKALNVSQRAVSGWMAEDGGSRPRLDKRHDLADFFDVPLEVFEKDSISVEETLAIAAVRERAHILKEYGPGDKAFDAHKEALRRGRDAILSTGAETEEELVQGSERLEELITTMQSIDKRLERLETAMQSGNQPPPKTEEELKQLFVSMGAKEEDWPPSPQMRFILETLPFTPWPVEEGVAPELSADEKAADAAAVAALPLRPPRRRAGDAAGAPADTSRRR